MALDRLIDSDRRGASSDGTGMEGSDNAVD
jgi:hypothetical protein